MVLSAAGALALCVVLVFLDALCNVCLANVERKGVVISGNVRRSPVGADAAVGKGALSIGEPHKVSIVYEIGGDPTHGRAVI